MLRGERDPGSRWGEQDSLLAQALTFYESLLCAGCGHPITESMDPATEGRWVAPYPSRCHACTAIAHRAKDYEKADAAQALKFSAHLGVRTADVTEPEPYSQV